MRVNTSSSPILENAIACILSLLPPFINFPRNEITMSPPMSSGIQVPCLPLIDPPYSNKYELPPITFIKLPHNTIPPPLQPSAPPPSNEIQILSPSNVTIPLPLSTILFRCPRCSSQPYYFRLRPPPSSSALPLTLSLPHITCHRTSESIALEAQQNPPSLVCAQSICRQWPSGATAACLSREYRDVIVHAACGQQRQNT